MDDVRIRSVLEILDPPPGFSPWHGGPSLMGSLRGVEAGQAAWKPAPDRHSIWELCLHIAYWKYAVRRRLDPDAVKGFDRSPANWPEIIDSSEVSWKVDKQLIKKEHDALNSVILKLPPSKLDKLIPDKRSWTYGQLINGILLHDTYHIGQIQLMKRLYVSLNGRER